MTEEPQKKQFPCGQCGAKVEFVPGTAALECPYCGHSNPIPQSEEDIRELDFRGHLAGLAEQEETVEIQTVRCDTCAGETTLEPNVTAGACAFCGANIVATAKSSKAIKPRSILPFEIDRDVARTAFRDWVDGLWFAPNLLKQYARTDSRLTGVYTPYWTYDASTTSWYTGLRGDVYYVTETYVTMVNGKPTTQTRQVQKIRWTPASGVVWNSFDDILVLASTSLPEKYANKLTPWGLENLVPYQDAYLSGFRAESYHVSLDDGFEQAQGVMDGHIRTSVRRDIGGDQQQITSLRTQYDDVTFKHILLPVWMSAYRYKKKVFRFLINGRTGEVQGERPWSFWKIFVLVVAILAAIGAVIAIVALSN